MRDVTDDEFKTFVKKSDKDKKIYRVKNFAQGRIMKRFASAQHEAIRQSTSGGKASKTS